MTEQTETQTNTGSLGSFGGIEIDAKPRVVIPVKLVGIQYKMTPPKTALALDLAKKAKDIGDDPDKMMDLLTNWMEQGFTKPVAKKIMARMEDPADDMDFEHIIQLMQAVIARAAENPTT